MSVDFVIDGTPSCAIDMLTEEEWYGDKGAGYGKRPSIKEAAQSIKEHLATSRTPTFLATVVQNQKNPEIHPDYDWWCKVYKKAGFKQFGKTMFNPNSGNMVTKFYYDNVPKAKEVK